MEGEQGNMLVADLAGEDNVSTMSRAPSFSEKVTLELRHDGGGVSHAWGIGGRRPGSVGRKMCGRGRERGACGWGTAVSEGGVTGDEPTGPTAPCASHQRAQLPSYVEPEDGSPVYAMVPWATPDCDETIKRGDTL